MQNLSSLKQRRGGGDTPGATPARCLWVKLRKFSYNFAHTTMSESKQSFYLTKNSLIINFKGKLQNSFDFVLRCQTRAVFGLVTCLLKYYLVLSCGGIRQFNSDNRSQQYVEAIYRSFNFISHTDISSFPRSEAL